VGINPFGTLTFPQLINRLYPNIVLSMRKHFSAKMLRVISQSRKPRVAELLEEENRR
jgi:hypothetical protein